MVGIHQTGSRHNAMAVAVGITAKCKVKVAFHVDKRGHGIRRRTVHADFTIVIERHKTKGGVNIGLGVGHIEVISFRDGIPEIERGTA